MYRNSVDFRICCKKYYIEGPKAGSVEMFVENLPGIPDNIRYDGHGLYWIALSTVIDTHDVH